MVEWSGWIDGNFSWQVIADEDVAAEDLQIEVILSYMDDWTEHEDLPNTVPSPGSQGDYPNINTSSPCRLQYCTALDIISEGVLYVGALADKNDKDAVMIVGDSGDVLSLIHI